MNTRRRFQLVALTLCAAALAACGDSRIKAIKPGISKDSAMKLITGKPAAGDTLTNIYHRGMFFINGKIIEVYLVDFEGRRYPAEKVPDKEVTPVVLVDGKVVGTGWKAADSLQKATNIPVHDMK